MTKLWGGRFSKDSSELMEDFHSSISFDQKLYYWDIRGSQAHAKMLAKQGIISKDEGDILVKGLEEILHDIESGKIAFNLSDEDIHMNIEHLLTDKVGDAGKKLHTARSRNDQVALDLRMYLRDEVCQTLSIIYDFIDVLLKKSEENIDVIMPGYTHLQRAQPILFSHHLMAYAEMFSRDAVLLQNWLVNHNVMALGSCALAGTTFPIDRNFTASELNFDNACINSIDGVSDRDFVLDYVYAASRSLMHLSRFCEEIILWSSQEFAFVNLDDAYSTGSSIMPQKKNPDVAELVRGKTGRVYGHLVGLLTMMKGIPLAYNKDMQEDKEALFDTVETWKKCMIIFSKMIETMSLNKENMLKAAKGGFTNATDLADYLAKKNVPFREAHRIVGEMVAYCLMNNCSLEDLSIEKMKSFSYKIEDDVYSAIDVFNCVNNRNSLGGPSKENVINAINIKKKQLENWRNNSVNYNI